MLILREDARVGQSFAEYLGRAGGDVVYDLEITPNRPDLNSVIGIAREISASTGNPLKMPEVRTQETGGKIESLVAVRIEDAELCPRYTARVVRGVRIGPSPDWLRNTLEKVGVRSINNVVDVTNYVMLEVGQPLHAFDYHLLAPKGDRRDACPVIVVRRASEGEKSRTLDGQERTLTHQMLLIADETKAVALAGVMGGQNSEINLNTVDVLIESAYFKPQNIRATSRKLELRTESSYRFERGGDIGICDWASQRAAQLILEAAGGILAMGVVDACPKHFEPKQIALRPTQTNAVLGVEVAVRPGEETDNAANIAPDVYRTQYGLWSNSLIRTYPDTYDVTASPLYLVGRDGANSRGICRHACGDEIRRRTARPRRNPHPTGPSAGCPAYRRPIRRTRAATAWRSSSCAFPSAIPRRLRACGA